MLRPCSSMGVGKYGSMYLFRDSFLGVQSSACDSELALSSPEGWSSCPCLIKALGPFNAES
jgi:hypothetical protein